MASRHEAMRSATQRATAISASAAVAVAAGGFLACQAFGGHPGGDVTSTLSAPTSEVMPWCLGTCVPDPGSGPVDCSVATGIDTLPVLTFDDAQGCDALGQNCSFYAADLYAYADGTAMPFFLDTPAVPASAATAGYQPPTEDSRFSFASAVSPPTLCTPANHVLHMIGGLFPDNGNGDFHGSTTGGTDGGSVHPTPFHAWGGGIGIAMQKFNDSDGQGDSQKAYCGSQDAHYRPDVCPPSTAEYAVRVAALDVSTYDGVSFWGRRGPNSQAGIGVTVGDQYTDDDLSYLTYRNDPTAPRHCERVRDCRCSNFTQCTYQDPVPLQLTQSGSTQFQPGFYCIPLDPVVFQSINGGGSNVICDVTECNQPYAAYPNFELDGGMTTASGGKDPQFYGRPCTPYSWPDGNGSLFCFDPATGPPPALGTERCGDHWMKMVDLNTDWHFYKVPFTDLRQQGFAKKSEQLDLHAVSVVRFTWTAGWIDYWIDEVSFYRNVK